MRRFVLVLFAMLIGVAVPAAYSVLYSLLAHRPLDLSSDVDLVNVAIVAGPYLLLALFGVKQIVPWVVALALTLLLWAHWLNSTVSYRWHPDGSGADVGTAFLIMTSWLWISLAAFGIHALQRHASSPE